MATSPNCLVSACVAAKWPEGLTAKFASTLVFRPLAECLGFIKTHECVFKSLHFHFTENAIKVLHPHNRFHIFLPVHTGTMKMSENALTFYSACVEGCYFNSWAYTFNCQFTIKIDRSEIPIKNKWKSTGTETGTGSETQTLILLHFQNFLLWRAFSKVCVLIFLAWTGHENAAKCLQNENAFNNNNNKFISLPKRLFRANLQIM